MADELDDARHYSLSNVDLFWTEGSPIVLPIAGEPSCSLTMDPANGLLTLTTPFTPPEPDLGKWRHVRFRPVASDDVDLAEISVQVEGNVHGAYGLLVSIADQLQLEGDPLAAAVATAIAKHRGMFAAKGRLSLEKEVGLFGELLLLEFLFGAVGVEAGVASWQGPLSEEHDFVFADVHLEVKTTSSEQRRHMMHGFTQLVPLRGVPLSLVSVQLTRSNADGGRTLGQLVSELRKTAGGHRPQLDAALEVLGWVDEDHGLYTTFWVERNRPRAYDVDDRFPALTLKRLDSVVPNMTAVSDLSYRIDVTSFDHAALPGSLAGFVETPGGDQ